MYGKVTKISGPLVVAEGLEEAKVSDVVHVGKQRLIGEILNMTEDCAAIQMYEDTVGLGCGAEVEATGYPLYVELGPGMLGGIFDGISRPLTELHSLSGDNITRGIDIPALSREKLWEFVPQTDVGDKVVTGDIIGTVQETGTISHKIMVPFGVSGTVASIQAGSYTVTDSVCLIKGDNGENYKITLVQKWPVRKTRPYVKKHIPSRPLCTGQRVIDSLFPIAKGGTATITGPTGSGKTVLSHQIAKMADVDIVVYIGCGERGNEMANIIAELSELNDPRREEKLINRTVMVANTSDMPIMACESSMYFGITIAEYFRDMGYDVALIVDSTSRWAEALLEMSHQLEEMPGDEGYPAYLNSRIAQFYERAGFVECLGSDERTGSLTVIGTVSPAGGSVAEPVLQATKRCVRAVWNLDSGLASARHFPALSWLTGYSLYAENLKRWFDEELGVKFMQNREKTMNILGEEAGLDGQDEPSPTDRLTLESAKMLREDFIKQNAFDDADSCVSLERQSMLLQIILDYDTLSRTAIERGADINKLITISECEQIGRAKSLREDKYRDTYLQISENMKTEINEISEEAENSD